MTLLAFIFWLLVVAALPATAFVELGPLGGLIVLGWIAWLVWLSRRVSLNFHSEPERRGQISLLDDRYRRCSN